MQNVQSTGTVYATGTTADVPRKPQVGAQLDEFDSLAGNLIERVEVLSKHLSPVLRPVEEPNLKEMLGEVRQPDCELAEMLRDRNDRLRVVLGRIDQIIATVDL